MVIMQKSWGKQSQWSGFSQWAMVFGQGVMENRKWVGRDGVGFTPAPGDHDHLRGLLVRP